MRAWKTWSAWLAVWLFAPSAAAPPRKALPNGPCGGLPPLEVLWRFGAGARPVGGPLAGRDGSVYVGTSEGYVHALRADGSYRWSYTLRGPVSGRAALTAAGAVLVPTAREVYALRPEGSLLWTFNSPLRVLGDLARDARGHFRFASEDGRLFALSAQGALVTHLPGRVPFSVLQVELPNSAIAAARRNGEILLMSAGRTQRFATEAPASSLLGCPGAELCAISQGSLLAFGGPGAGFRTPALRAAANAELLATLPSERRLELFRGTQGTALFSVALPEAASAAPALDSRGTTYVPLKSGALLAVTRDGLVKSCAEVGRSPLGTPVLDEARRRLLVTANAGELAAVALE